MQSKHVYGRVRGRVYVWVLSLKSLAVFNLGLMTSLTALDPKPMTDVSTDVSTFVLTFIG